MFLHNCLTVVGDKLIGNGFVMPNFQGLSYYDNRGDFLKFANRYVKDKTHIRYFESFCDYVDKPKKNDIIVYDTGVGICINKYKYMTIKDKNSKIILEDIKDNKILRIREWVK